MSSHSSSHLICDEQASGWMHRGIDLLNANTPTSLEEAVRCFDQAIAMRSKLPLEANPPYRYGLAAGWINRGDALTRLGGTTNLAEALKSYDEALGLLRSLNLSENPLYPRRLAIALINRGSARQLEASAVARSEVVDSFRESLSVLNGSAAASLADLDLLRAGTMTNLAGALLDVFDEPSAEARNLTQQALLLIKEAERNHAMAAEIGFKARHALCRAIARESQQDGLVPSELLEAATDAVDEGLALSRYWQQRGENAFRALAEDLFRFGCRIYQSGQPRFLSEFILESLDPDTTNGALPLNQKNHDAAVAALWNALKDIQQDGFSALSSSRFEQVLDSLQDLRVTEKRLEQLRQLAIEQRTHNHSSSILPGENYVDHDSRCPDCRATRPGA